MFNPRGRNCPKTSNRVLDECWHVGDMETIDAGEMLPVESGRSTLKNPAGVGRVTLKGDVV